MAVESTDVQTWRVHVRGRVQGVGYREACVERARALGLSGWVRNRVDGTVEVLLQGRADALAAMHAWLREGPPSAIVDEAQATPLVPPYPHLAGFDRRPTA